MNTNFTLLLAIIGLAFCNANNLRSNGGPPAIVDEAHEQQHHEHEENEDPIPSRELIINGDDAGRGRYPWMVRYSYFNTLCGGSLIVSSGANKNIIKVHRVEKQAH